MEKTMSEQADASFTIRVEVWNTGDTVIAAIDRGLKDIGVAPEIQQHLQYTAQPPAWVEFITSLPGWIQIFSAIASVYVTTWTVEAAKDHYKNRKQIASAVLKAVGAGADKIR